MEKPKLLELIVSGIFDAFFGILFGVFRDSFFKLLSTTPTDLATTIYATIAAGALVGFGILSYHIFILLTKPRKETRVTVYQRKEPKLDKFLESAKKRINIFGITLEETSRDTRDTLVKILKKQDIENIDILIFNPDSKLKPFIERQVHENINTLASSIQTLRDLRKDISADEFAKLHVKLSDEIPVQSIFIIDPNEKHSIIRFEPYVYGITKQRRRIFEISRKKQRKIYDIHVDSFNNLWREGKELQS